MLRIVTFTCLAAATTTALLGCAAHNAQAAGSERPTYSITKKAYEQLEKVGDLAQKKQWDAALAELDRMAERKYLNPYERAMMWQARSGVHFAKTEYEQSAKDMEQALALDAMPEQVELDAQYNLAQLYFTLERFGASADMFAKWAAHKKTVQPSNDYVIASAYAQAHRFAEALPYAQKAVDGMKEPKEPWLALLVSLQYEQHRDAEVAAVLERLVQTFPKREYWLQLCETYLALGKGEHALAALEHAYAAGMLTEDKDLVNLARLYLKQDQPAKCTALLEQHMQDGKVDKSAHNLELEAMCYVAAKDAAHAEAALGAAGSGLSSGEPFMALARLQAEQGAWEKARESSSSAIQRGLASPGSGHLLLGAAHYNTKHKDAALASFAEAKKHPESAACADAWIQAVKSNKHAPLPDCELTAAAAPVADAAGPAKAAAH